MKGGVLSITHWDNWSFGLTLAIKFHCSWVRAENKTRFLITRPILCFPSQAIFCQDLSPLGVSGRVLNIKFNEGTVPANKQQSLTCTCLVMYSHTPNPRVFRINSAGMPNPHQGHWKAGAAEGARARVRARVPPSPSRRLSSICNLRTVLHQPTEGEQTARV